MTIRDEILAQNAEVGVIAKNYGININDIRKETRGSQSVMAQVIRQVNETSPTLGHERIYQDDFAGQTFNGTNTDFTISQRVLGQNILLNRVEQSTGTLMPLRRTTNPAPGGDEFWFDGLFTVRVGTAPGSFDALLATYVTVL